MLRYLATGWVATLAGRDFPYGTLFVNVTGSLLIGVLSIVLLERLQLDAEWRAAIIIGVLGSFTTFSTFSLDTLNLFQQGQASAAMMNMFSSVLVCMLAVWIGIIIGRQLA